MPGTTVHVGGTVVVLAPAPRRPGRPPRRPVRGSSRRPGRGPIRRRGRAGSWSRRIGRDRIAVVVVVVVVALGIHTRLNPTTPTAPTAAPSGTAVGGSGCTVTDPTGTGGCVTPTTAHALAEIDRVFGGYRKGPTIRSATCWDRHAWNPTSDHPKGRACDFYFGKAGVFATDAELNAGWELANWLRANAEPLRVRYLIWQARIWQAGRGDVGGGWGTPYRGGGVYDPTDAVGGHFDHVHVSFQP